MKTHFLYLLSSLLICFFQLDSSAQKANIDSLEKCLSVQLEDTNKVNVFYQLAKAYEKKDPNKGVHYGIQALQLSQRLSFDQGIDRSLMEIGTCNYLASNFDSSLLYTKRLLNLRINEATKVSLADPYRILGNNYYGKSDLDSALWNYFASLRSAEEFSDVIAQGSAWTGIGNVYHQQQNLDQALDAHQKGLKLLLKTGDKGRIGKSYNNIGNIYLEKQEYLKAKEYYERSMKIKEELNDFMGMAMTLGNQMSIALQFEKDTAKAYALCMRSIAIRKKISDKQGLAMSYVNLAVMYEGRANDTAILFADTALQIAREIGYKTGMTNSYLSLSHSYANNGNYKKAYDYHLWYTEMKDSVLSVESSNQINEMNAKYESAKKDQQLLLRDAEAKQNALERTALIIGFGLTLVFSFILFRGYRHKQKANVVIMQQKDVMEAANKNITASINYAKNIQQSQLPSEKSIHRNLERLNPKKPN